MSWAKLPTRWLRRMSLDEARQRWGAAFEIEPADDGMVYPLTFLKWRKDGASSMAALVILQALAIQLNLDIKGKQYPVGSARPKQVAMTYDALQRMTGFSRGAVNSGLGLLLELGAITKTKVGRAGFYELQGIDTGGDWAQLPQLPLLKAADVLVWKSVMRTKVTLHALKAYMVLVALRSQRFGTTAIGYTALTRWTGVRREDLKLALSHLTALGLITLSSEQDDRHVDGDRSNRYCILGLQSIRQAGPAATELASVAAAAAGQQHAAGS